MNVSDQVKAGSGSFCEKRLHEEVVSVLVLGAGGAVLTVAMLSDGTLIGSVCGALAILLGLAVYLVVNKNQVWVVNLFFGWSFIGWVVAMTMAFSPNVEK